jgi:hypothetical protein
VDDVRWSLASLVVLLAGAALWSCGSTPSACVDYCGVVAGALRNCGLQDDFDQPDCIDRLVDVDATVCELTATQVGISDCGSLANDFCGDDTFACPEQCFSDCCADTDCPPALAHCDAGSCKECVSHDDCPTHSCYLDACVECTEETQAEACPAGQACDYPNTCRRTCVEDDDCGQWHTCLGNVCSESVGTPCPDGSCGPGFCQDVDAAGMPTAKYCTVFCSDGDDAPCPPGFSCVENYCRSG